MLWLGLRGLIKRAWYGFGPLYYFVSVSIFSSILTPNVSAYNDRFLFNPSLGIEFLAGWCLMRWVKTDETDQVAVFLKKNALPVGLVAVLALVSVWKIESHLPVWKDRYVLFRHDAQLAPNNARLRKNNGGSYARLAVQLSQSDPGRAMLYADSAITELKAALNKYDIMATGHIHMGNMYIIKGQYPEAEQALKRALEIEGSNVFALSSLANVLFRQGKNAEAKSFIEAVRPDLRNKNDWDLAYRIYLALGETQKAADCLSRVQN
jgi:tetratricopeptide (TPR) repeat protein